MSDTRPTFMSESELFAELEYILKCRRNKWDEDPPVIITPKYDGFHFEARRCLDLPLTQNIEFYSKNGIRYVPLKEYDELTKQGCKRPSKDRFYEMPEECRLMGVTAHRFMSAVLHSTGNILNPAHTQFGGGLLLYAMQCEFCLVPKAGSGFKSGRIDLLLHWPFPSTMSFDEILATQVDVVIRVHGCRFITEEIDMDTCEWMAALERVFPEPNTSIPHVSIHMAEQLYLGNGSAKRDAKRIMNLLMNNEGIVMRRSYDWIHELYQRNKTAKRFYPSEVSKIKLSRLLPVHILGFTVRTDGQGYPYPIIADVLYGIKTADGKYTCVFHTSYPALFDFTTQFEKKKTYLLKSKLTNDFGYTGTNGIGPMYNKVMKLFRLGVTQEYHIGIDRPTLTNTVVVSTPNKTDSYTIDVNPSRTFYSLVKGYSSTRVQFLTKPVPAVLKFNTAWFIQSRIDLAHLHLQAAAVMDIDYNEAIMPKVENPVFAKVYANAPALTPAVLAQAIHTDRLQDHALKWLRFVTNDDSLKMYNYLRSIGAAESTIFNDI